MHLSEWVCHCLLMTFMIIQSLVTTQWVNVSLSFNTMWTIFLLWFEHVTFWWDEDRKYQFQNWGPSWSWSYGNLDFQLPVQSVPITTKVVSSSPVHGEVYSIQHYVIKFVSDLRQVCGFLRVLLFPPPIKLTAMI